MSHTTRLSKGQAVQGVSCCCLITRGVCSTPTRVRCVCPLSIDVYLHDANPLLSCHHYYYLRQICTIVHKRNYMLVLVLYYHRYFQFQSVLTMKIRIFAILYEIRFYLILLNTVNYHGFELLRSQNYKKIISTPH